MGIKLTRRITAYGIILTLVALGFGALISSSTARQFDSQWQSLAKHQDMSPNWRRGNAASLGQTDAHLLFKLAFEATTREQHLTVSPAYLDIVDVGFLDADSNLIETIIKGDSTSDLALDHSFDIGQLVFAIPPLATHAYIEISATENLQANVNLVSRSQLIRDNYLGLIFKSSILMVIAAAAIAGIMACIWSGQVLYGVFGVHQIAWFCLLLELSYFVPSLVPETVYLNSLLLGATTIVTTVTGTAFHWQLLRQLVRAKWLNGAFFITILVTLLNLMMYLFTDQRLALMSNSITMVVATVSFIIAIPLTPSQDHRQAFILRKIIWAYVFLMLLVVAAALSRLGFGNGALLPFVYLFALVTMLLLGYMLFIRFIVQRRQKTNALATAKLVAATNNQLNLHVEEQSALLSMLSHEIKTPLTTLKLLIFRSPIREQLSYQLKSIENVVDTVALMDHLKSEFINEEIFDLKQLVQAQWRQLQESTGLGKQLNLEVATDKLLKGNRLALEVIVGNLLSNAQKYGTNSLVQVRIRSIRQQLVVEVENTCTGLAVADTDLLTKKYYRADNTSGLRGTGLGLWISRTLCEANGYHLTLDVDQCIFTASIRL
ncbi:MAG TPA: hypothetical protein DE179_14160 [Oceanospirillaceae bacterium]|nr:hypothetical protein [Oceanospirillaceae bacterium]